MDMTKRWRVTKGPMKQFDRGAVWEGYAVNVDKSIELSADEREKAWLKSGLIDAGFECELDPEIARRRQKIEEMLEVFDDAV